MRKLINGILLEHRLFGFRDPSWFLWAASQLTRSASEESQAGGKDPLVPWALFLAGNFMRQAIVCSPFDLDLFPLIFQLEGLNPGSAQTKEWLLWARERTKGIPLSSQAKAVDLVDKVRNDPDAILARLNSASGKEPPLNEAYLYLLELWRLMERDAFLKQLERFRARPGAAPAGPVLAGAAWGVGERDLAMELLEMSPENYLRHNLLAEVSLERGDVDEARAHWRLSLKFEPLQPLLVYKLRDSLRPAPDAGLPKDVRIHIVFYTFNKLDMTLDTLESLLASEIGDCPVTLLNNGSTAFSPEELQAGVDRVRQGRPVNLIHLPTNIGAPAARNWLRTLPASRETDYLAYLDDDVLLPNDWLTRYVHDLQEHPEVCCVGPLCMNSGAPPTIQYIWRFFEIARENKIKFTTNCPQFMDFGQFNLQRPSLSVMGCCHLFDMRRWHALNIPDFDIRFSPSQVDDLEHDMQIWKAGGRVLYDGHVRVVHRQMEGKKKLMSRESRGSVMANHDKMEAKWGGDELSRVDAEVWRVDGVYWRETMEMVCPLLPEQARNLLANYSL